MIVYSCILYWSIINVLIKNGKRLNSLSWSVGRGILDVVLLPDVNIASASDSIIT